MALIGNIHIHVHVNYDRDEVMAKLDKVLQNQEIMAKKSEELNAKVDRIVSAVSGVTEDVRYIKQQLSEARENGLTAEEAQALDDKLAPVVERLEALDAETDSTPPTEEQPEA